MTKNKEEVVITSVAIKADVPNKNGIIYPRDVLSKAIKKWNDGPKLGAFVEPNVVPDNVSATQLKDAAVEAELEMCKEGVRGKAIVLSTPKGEILKKMLNGGWKPEIGICCQASIHTENGNTVVEDDMEIIRVSIIDKNEKV